jgi:hypothetical protein
MTSRTLTLFVARPPKKAVTRGGVSLRGYGGNGASVS